MPETQSNVKFKKKYIEVIGEKILNNKDYGDVTFVVNDKHYYACRIVMSAASEVFEDLMNEHFNNCTDQEVLVAGVKHNESFLNILKYIHGDINFDLISRVVLCEMIHLSDYYKLNDLHSDILDCLKTLNQYEVNSIVALLNTSKTYDVTHLYEKLKKYVYKHTEEVVKHKSFVDLKYDVLLDLLKSDWLYCKEIDILRAALNWHDENIIDNGIVEIELNEDVHMDNCKTEADDSFIKKDFLENTVENTKPPATVNSNEVKDSILNNSCNQLDANSDVYNDREVVEFFSENIMKTLLNNIRFFRVPMCDYLNSMNSEIFIKYKDVIMKECNNPQLSKNERILFSPKIFTVKNIVKNNLQENKMFFSEETFYLGNLRWGVRAKVSYETQTGELNTSDDDKYIGLYLCCKSRIDNVVKVTLDAQLTLMSTIGCKTLKFSERRFTNKENDYGWALFMRFSELFHPERKIVCNDTISVEVVISNLSITESEKKLP